MKKYKTYIGARKEYFIRENKGKMYKRGRARIGEKRVRRVLLVYMYMYTED